MKSLKSLLEKYRPAINMSDRVQRKKQMKQERWVETMLAAVPSVQQRYADKDPRELEHAFNMAFDHLDAVE